MEEFEIVTPEGEVMGRATRQQCHTDPRLLHQVSHVLVFDWSGRLYLQLRAATKDIQPGKWDTSVGGHVAPGETFRQTAYRELAEELGIVLPDETGLTRLYRYLWRSPQESELVETFRCLWDGPFTPHPEELDGGRFWTTSEIEAALGTGQLTPNCEHEWQRYQSWLTQAMSELPPHS